MKFISSVKLLPLTSIASSEPIVGRAASSGSKSATVMLLTGQRKLYDALASTVNAGIESPIWPREKHPVRRMPSPVNGKECSFEVKPSSTINELIYQKADLGILEECGDAEHICVEDKGSSLGGRCVRPREAGRTILNHTAVDEVERELQCEKCVGQRACYYTDPSKVACGSCIGTFTCYGFFGPSIGANSCIGDFACDRAANLNSVGNGSCVGQYACSGASGNVGDGSCNGERACYNLFGKLTQFYLDDVCYCRRYLPHVCSVLFFFSDTEPFYQPQQVALGFAHREPIYRPQQVALGISYKEPIHQPQQLALGISYK
ncbi:hypothetical protein HJC23_002450 [Cyclotella cryptica]|uniref:DUF7640 domain-containing protein n=1 Tax=Cyclotella cryptica TaxID=29204 RepID=A0ABD3PW33_9STRA